MTDVAPLPLTPFSSDPRKEDPSGTVGLVGQPLTISEHLDGDKHWIGEALPAASVQEMSSVGSSASIGTSPFPARADHGHGVDVLRGIHNCGNVVVGAGRSYLNAWAHSSRGNLLAPASTQIFLIPLSGVWQMTAFFTTGRVAGGNYAGQVNIGVRINPIAGGFFDFYLYRNEITGLPGTQYVGVTLDMDFVTGDYFQYYVEHNDGSNWNMTAYWQTLTRIAN